MTVVPLACRPMPIPDPESRAAVRPRNDVSAVWPMRTMRAEPPASGIPSRLGRVLWAARRGGSVSGTGSEVAVRVIDRTEHPPVPDDGRGLQVITGDPLAPHGDQGFGLAPAPAG